MPMRDASSVGTKTTQALGTAAATVNQATAFDLVSANVYAVPVWIHVYYPSNPTGTTPTIVADVQESSDNATFTALGSLHTVDNTTTGFPKEYHQGVLPRKRYLRVSFTITGTTPAYGTAQIWLTAKAEHQRSWP